MRYLKGTFYAFLAQESGQIQFLIIAPILALSFLSLIVRTASSAVDPSLEKKKVTEQLKRRLSEVQNEGEISSLQKIPSSVQPGTLRQTPQTEIQSIEEEVSPLLLEQPPRSVAPQQVSRRVKKKETLESLLREEGLEPKEITRWVTAARKVQGFKGLRAGHTLTLSFSATDTSRVLNNILYEIDKKTSLRFEKKADGSILSKREVVPTTLLWRIVGGRITSNLYNAAKKAGVPERLLDDLADMDWDVDLSSDLHSGDIFKVIFEETQHGGKVIEYGNILAAEIITRGKSYTLFSIAGKEEKWDSNPEAHNRQFLRYPLKFSRISSVFTEARFHPVLRRTRPHLGVDFAAPAGTPVRSVAKGKVVHAGRFGGYGNFVRVDHPGPYDSAYAHLQRIAKGLKVGVMVERGQVIGYVGSTGMATGPHLHFELYKNGNYINPLTAKLPVIEESPAETRQNQFLAKAKKHLREQLAALQVGNQPVSLVRANPFREERTTHDVASSTHEPQRLALNASKAPSPARRKASSAREQQAKIGKTLKRAASRR